ncbi:MAG: D-tyrosyl-tRNA(Tyr) deacylase [Clostridia bacterium]|nr:D-tyrosyl-tRNA(Tyr) deacylase [Clostridia bacterium]
MIAILQRVTNASVTIDGEMTASIGRGFMVLLGVAKGDTETDAELLADKVAKMRVFEDENGKMNLSVTDIGGEVLVVPNFTLLASYRRGNRPDFMNSERPEEAKRLFTYFCDYIGKTVPTARGTFGADMKVSLLNDGPVTIPMDSAVLKAPKNA